MAYAQSRSANRELEMGMVEGAYKMHVKDRGGVVEHTTCRNIDDLSVYNFDICEAPVMQTPDGQSMTSMYSRTEH